MPVTKTRKLSRNEIAIARVAQVISAGHVLVAHNAMHGEDTTVGPYSEAHAADAAECFVMERVV